MQGEIVLHNLTYRYAPSEPEVLRGVTLRIAPGEFVALSGTSGCGKSTLIKIVAGLYKPSYGNVYIDGQPLSRWNAQSLRSQIALAAQDDSLLQGTLAENISGFDEQIEMRLVRVCVEPPLIGAPPGGWESGVRGRKVLAENNRHQWSRWWRANDMQHDGRDRFLVKTPVDVIRRKNLSEAS